MIFHQPPTVFDQPRRMDFCVPLKSTKGCFQLTHRDRFSSGFSRMTNHPPPCCWDWWVSFLKFFQILYHTFLCHDDLSVGKPEIEIDTVDGNDSWTSQLPSSAADVVISLQWTVYQQRDDEFISEGVQMYINAYMCTIYIYVYQFYMCVYLLQQPFMICSQMLAGPLCGLYCCAPNI